MTNGATVFDQLVTRIETLLPSHKRLPNPYDLSENNPRYLDQGWGLALSPLGENTARFVCAKRSVKLTFQLAITRRFYALEHDAEKKAAADKSLLDDFEIILDDSHLNDMNVDGLNIVGGFFGTQAVIADKDLFRAILINMTVEYFRS